MERPKTRRGWVDRDTWRSKLFRHCPMKVESSTVDTEKSAHLDNLLMLSTCSALSKKLERVPKPRRALTKEACTEEVDTESNETQCVSTPSEKDELVTDETCKRSEIEQGVLMHHSWLPQFLQGTSKVHVQQHKEAERIFRERSQPLIETLDLNELRVLRISNNNNQEDSRSMDAG